MNERPALQNVSDMADISVLKYQNIGVKSLWEYKTGIFWAHFNNNSGIHLQNSLQDAIFGIFVLKYASYAHLIL